MENNKDIDYLEKVTKEFTEFLEKHEALDRFKEELFRQDQEIGCYPECTTKEEMYLTHIKFICMESDVSNVVDLVSSSFYFSAAKEGHNYWSTINHGWRTIRNEDSLIPTRL